MRTLLHFVELFIVILLEINVHHLPANLAFFDISSTVREVGSYFGLGELLVAVVAALHWLHLHQLFVEIIYIFE